MYHLWVLENQLRFMVQTRIHQFHCFIENHQHFGVNRYFASEFTATPTHILVEMCEEDGGRQPFYYITGNCRLPKDSSPSPPLGHSPAKGCTMWTKASVTHPSAPPVKSRTHMR